MAASVLCRLLPFSLPHGAVDWSVVCNYSNTGHTFVFNACTIFLEAVYLYSLFELSFRLK